MQWILDEQSNGEVIVYYDRKLRLRALDLDEAKTYVVSKGWWENRGSVILQEPDGYERDITKEMGRVRGPRLKKRT